LKIFGPELAERLTLIVTDQKPADRRRIASSQRGASTVTNISSEALDSVRHLADAWRVIVLNRGPADVRDVPGMAIRWADSQDPFWNCITFTEQGVDARLLDERLAQAAATMRQKRQPGFIWLFEDLLEPSARAGLPDAADRAGLSLSLSGFGMSGDFLPIPEPTHPDLRFVRVSTEGELIAYADLNSRAYAMPLEAGRDGLRGSALWKSGMYMYLGLKEGVPVSAAATLETNGCLLLAMVATAPEAQRKGYGEATVRKALFEGAKATGLTRTVLHATMAGAPVYERIGYRKVTRIELYTLRT
jgi:GNAT superfamily N-acetyltransferase